MFPKAFKIYLPKDERRLGLSFNRQKDRWSFRIDLWTKSFTWRVIPYVGSRFIYVIRRDREHWRLPYAFEVINGHDALAQPDFSFKTKPYALLNWFTYSWGGNALVLVVPNGISMRVALELKQARIDEYLNYRVGTIPVIHLEKANTDDIVGINDFLTENDLHVMQLCDIPTGYEVVCNDKNNSPVVYTDKLEIHDAT